jgi:hypothetical protein
MIVGMSVGAFTLLHVIITLIAIGSGLIVLGGMLASRVQHASFATSRARGLPLQAQLIQITLSLRRPLRVRRGSQGFKITTGRYPTCTSANRREI